MTEWDEYSDEPARDEEEELRPHDPAVDLAKQELREHFQRSPETVYYERQLQVIFEGTYFHWITGRALSELAAEGAIASNIEILPTVGHIRFYRAKSHRYWRRQAAEIAMLVQRFSIPEFTRALGDQGETMFDAALPRGGFLPKAMKVREYNGRTWLTTGHDLDRVFERDGISYGTEIKNTLRYVPRNELLVKVSMCAHLGLRPLFIVRSAPKSYIEYVRQNGGFTLVFKYQLYPFGYQNFAAEVRKVLGIPVDCPARIEHGTIQRFLKWHLANMLPPKAP